MAGIREMVETVYAAAAFAERDLTSEARECLQETEDAPRRRETEKAPRPDRRPRVRV